VSTALRTKAVLLLLAVAMLGPIGCGRGEPKGGTPPDASAPPPPDGSMMKGAPKPP
jgi:hypothetical protein